MPNPSRREFLSAGLALPVAGAAKNLGLLGSDAEAKAPVVAPKLDYRTLGKTGLKVTSLGFGCMITSDPSVITRAADLGVNYFDTARGYQHGNNERMVAAALGDRRKQITLSTKSQARDRAGLMKELETSLAELKTDYVDIWYLHSRDKVEDINDEMIEVQQKAKQQGKIRFAGMSTHALPKMAPWTIDKKAFDVVLTVINFAVDKAMEDAIAAVAATGTGVVGMKVMAGGFKDVKPSDPIYPRLKRDGAMLAALKWTLKKPYIHTTIPSMTDHDQLDENLRAMAEPFAAADERVLAAKLVGIRPIYCSMCGECDGQCRKGLPVADVLRILSYADGYREFDLARERFQELAVEHQAVRCGDCAECTVHCPHGVQVTARLGRAQELLG
jgi:hypothetical protein